MASDRRRSSPRRVTPAPMVVDRDSRARRAPRARCAEKRADRKFVDAALANPNAKVLALFDLKVPIRPLAEGTSARIRWLSVRDAEGIAAPLEFVFLGDVDGFLAGNVMGRRVEQPGPFQHSSRISQPNGIPEAFDFAGRRPA